MEERMAKVRSDKTYKEIGDIGNDGKRKRKKERERERETACGERW